jgi:peptide/nickel transport system substrate-binding protein
MDQQEGTNVGGCMTWRASALILAMAVIATACGSAPPGSTTPTGTAAAIEPLGPISMRLLGNWTTLDIQGNAESSGSTIANAIYDRLVARGADGKMIPYLAESWTADASSATFKIRKDVTCEDGTPLTPTLIANSFKRLFDPATPSFNRPRIFGPGPYTVTADDATSTFKVAIGSPTTDLLAAFSHYAAGVICPEGLRDPAKLLDDAWGSGPYTLEEAVRGDHATLKIRKDWKWGPNGTTSAHLPEQITIKVVPNATTAANLVITGGLDIAQITGPDVPRLQNEKSLTVRESHGFQPFPMVFNHQATRPTSDERVREALMTAIDAKAWAQAAFDGRAIVTPSIATPDVPCHDASIASLVPAQSLDKAASLLKTAGWNLEGNRLMKDGKQMTITVISSQTFYQRAAPEYLQAQWNRLGINTVVNDTDQPTFLVNLRGANFDVVVVAGTGAPPFISYMMGSMSGPLPPSGSNYGHINDPELEAAITKAMTSTDCAGWAAVQRALLAKKHALPLAAPIWHWFTRGIDMIGTGSYIEFWSLRKAKA